KRVAANANLAQLGLGYRFRLLVLIRVEPRLDFQPLLGPRRPDQVDDDLQGLQRNPLPIACDVTEEPMLDLVPLARARWLMAKLARQARLVGELLHRPPPEPGSRTVAAPTIGRDQQPGRAGIAPLPQTVPPSADRGHGELGGVVADPDR